MKIRRSGAFLIPDPRLSWVPGSPGIFLQAWDDVLSAIRVLRTIKSNIITNSRYCASYVTKSVCVSCQPIQSSVRPHDTTEAAPFLKGIKQDPVEKRITSQGRPADKRWIPNPARAPLLLSSIASPVWLPLSVALSFSHARILAPTFSQSVDFSKVVQVGSRISPMAFSTSQHTEKLE